MQFSISETRPCTGRQSLVFLTLVRLSGRGTMHSRPHKIFLYFHDFWALLNKISEGVALSPLSILHKTH